MASSNGQKDVEKSVEGSRNHTPKSGFTDSGTSYDLSDVKESTPPVLQPPTGESSTMNGGLNGPVLEGSATHSLPITSSETAPLLDSCHLCESQEESGNCCFAACSCWPNLAIKFRRSIFGFFFQLLVCALPISAMVMGIKFTGNCPKAAYLPIYGAVVGAFGLLFIAIWIVVSCYNRRRIPCSDPLLFSLGGSLFVLYNLTLVDVALFAVLSPSFDPTSKDYCNETFYTYTIYKDTATAVAVILSLIIYLPGNRHFLGCHNCLRRLPAVPSYSSI